MIALNSKNGKVATSRFDSIKFQYNPSKNTESDDSTWLLEKGLSNLIDKLNGGYLIRFGINTSSNNLDDVESFEAFYIDYKGKASIEDILQLPSIRQYCIFYQSNNQQPLSARFYFLFDKKARDFKEVKLTVYLTYLMLFEELGNNLIGFEMKVPGREFLPGSNPCVILNSSALIPVDDFVTDAEDLGITLEHDKTAKNNTPKILATKKIQVDKTFEFQSNELLGYHQALRINTELNKTNPLVERRGKPYFKLPVYDIETAKQKLNDDGKPVFVDNPESLKAQNLKNWKSEKGLEEFINARNSGLCTRLGIKILGNSKKNIQAVYGFFLDSDGGMSLEKVFGLIPEKYFIGYQPSSRHTPESPRFHVIAKYSSPLSYEDHEILYKYLLLVVFKVDDEKLDNAVYDAGRIQFGSVHFFQIINLDNEFPVDEYLTKAKEYFESLKKKADTKSSKNLGSKKSEPQKVQSLFQYEASKVDGDNYTSITESITQYLYDNVWKGICNEDIEELYCLYPHSFSDRTDGLDFHNKTNDEMLAKWEGYNPFSKTDSSGSSFVVCEFGGKLPVWWDSSGEFQESDKNGLPRRGSSFIRYWFEVNKNYNNKFKNGEFNDNFVFVVLDICRHFDITRYPFNLGVEWLCKQLCLQRKHNIFIIDFGTAPKDKRLFFAFQPRTNVYVECGLTYLLQDLLLPWIDENNLSWVVQKLKDYYEKELEKPFPGMVNLCKKWFEQNNLNPHLEAIHTAKQMNLDLIPFRNGLYDLRTKKLIPNDGQAFNTLVRDDDYKPVASDDKVVKCFTTWLKNWVGHEPDYLETLVHYYICTAQNYAYYTGITPIFCGATGTGKSEPGKVAARMYPEDWTTSSTEPLNASNSHGMHTIIDKPVWRIEEINEIPTRDFEKFLSLVGEKGVRSASKTYNPKGRDERNGRLYFASFMDAETAQSVINAKKDGIFRRALFFEIPDRPYVGGGFKNKYFKEEMEILNYVKEHAKELFCYLISLDVTKSLIRLEELSNGLVFNKTTRAVKEDNSPYAQFILSEIEITNDDNDKLDATIIRQQFVKFCSDNGYKKLGDNLEARSFGRAFNKELKSKILGNNWIFDKKASNGKYFYPGLKFKDNYQSPEEKAMSNI